MEFAFGVIHWSPDQFWKSTMHELLAASAGHRKIHKPANVVEPLQRTEYDELKKKFGAPGKSIRG